MAGSARLVAPPVNAQMHNVDQICTPRPLAFPKRKTHCAVSGSLLGPIHTGPGTRRVHKFQHFSFDVACVQCGHPHSHQQVPFALRVASRVLCGYGLRVGKKLLSQQHGSPTLCFFTCQLADMLKLCNKKPGCQEDDAQPRSFIQPICDGDRVVC